jgi:hypothetical protein
VTRSPRGWCPRRRRLTCATCTRPPSSPRSISRRVGVGVGVGVGDRRPGRCAALPQRVRARYAARHPVRGRRFPVPVRAGAWRGPACLRGRRPAEGLRSRPGRRRGQRHRTGRGGRPAGGHVAGVQRGQR